MSIGLSLYINLIGTFLTAGTPAQKSEPKADKKPSGVHYSVTGEARESWQMAAKQVLQGELCGMAEPTDEQINTSAVALQQANEKHVKDTVPGVIFLNTSKPVDVDHRGKLTVFFSSDAEIFLPLPLTAEICPQVEAKQMIAEVPLAPIPKEQPTLEVPVEVPVELTPQVSETPSKEVAKLKGKIEKEVKKARGLISNLNQTGNAKMKKHAVHLANKKDAAEKALESNSESALKSALEELVNARRSANGALNRYLKSLKL